MKRHPASIGMLILVAAAISTGCHHKDQPTSDSGAATPAPAAPAPSRETLTIPAGAVLAASLDGRISTATSQAGDPFTATITEPVMVNGTVAVPAGARIHGVVRDVKAAGRMKNKARLTLSYETIVDPDGNSHPIAAVPLTLQAAGGTRGDVERIAGGGVLGAIVGGIAGGGKGAAIGAGSGAGAGTVLTLAHKGHDVVLPAGQQLDVRTTASTSVEVLAQR